MPDTETTEGAKNEPEVVVSAESAPSPDAGAAATAITGDDDRVFHLVHISWVTYELPAPSPRVCLTEVELPYRSIEMPIGLPEANALALALERTESPRPMTHELFSAALKSTGQDIVALRIVSVDEGVYRGELDLMGTRGRVTLDCRPSDGLILATRQSPPAPILVEEGVLDG
jgi:bifunctional DNase/RNase